MATCLGKSYSFSLSCVCFVNLCIVFFACSSFLFGFEGGLCDFIALISDQCLSLKFDQPGII